MVSMKASRKLCDMPSVMVFRWEKTVSFSSHSGISCHVSSQDLMALIDAGGLYRVALGSQTRPASQSACAMPSRMISEKHNSKLCVSHFSSAARTAIDPTMTPGIWLVRGPVRNQIQSPWPHGGIGDRRRNFASFQVFSSVLRYLDMPSPTDPVEKPRGPPANPGRTIVGAGKRPRETPCCRYATDKRTARVSNNCPVTSEIARVRLVERQNCMSPLPRMQVRTFVHPWERCPKRARYEGG